jgi:uncharacterized protein YacL
MQKGKRMIDIANYIQQNLPENASIEDLYAAIIEVEEQLSELKQGTRDAMIETWKNNPDAFQAFEIKQGNPRRIVAWKDLASTLRPDSEHDWELLLNEYTRVGDPVYTIKRKK